MYLGITELLKCIKMVFGFAFTSCTSHIESIYDLNTFCFNTQAKVVLTVINKDWV